MANHHKVLSLDASDIDKRAINILKALSSEVRLTILQNLGNKSYSVNVLANMLDIPVSTASMHVKILEDAELINTEISSAVRGTQKLCSRRFDQVLITLPALEGVSEHFVEVDMPIGAYVRFDVAPTCGLASENVLIGMMDDPISFLEPERINAQLLWFHYGYVEYEFPNRVPPGKKVTRMQVSMEVCSEAPMHNDNWPSDISVWVNHTLIGTWISPGDFGGSRGALTPDWWLDTDTQFGHMKRWETNTAGSYIDGIHMSDIKIEQLRLNETPRIAVRVGVQEDAANVGGINLFGRKFGNYPQDIVLRLWYE